jgi:hypothetical protein
VVEQVALVVAGPGHVAIRSRQNGRWVQLIAAVDDVLDPVGSERASPALLGVGSQQKLTSQVRDCVGLFV